MMIRSMQSVFILAIGMVLSVSPSLAADWTATETEKDGVRLVMSPDEPRDGKVTVELEELWRVGGDTESDEEFFGVIGSVITDEEGNAYLLDRQLAEIKVFSAEGDYIRTIGREGEGPAEFRMPSQILSLIHI